MDKVIPTTTTADPVMMMEKPLTDPRRTKTAPPHNDRVQATIPADLAPIADGLMQLKLKYWCEILERDWPTFKPADQQWLAPAFKRWIETELTSRHSASIQRRIHDAKL